MWGYYQYSGGFYILLFESFREVRLRFCTRGCSLWEFRSSATGVLEECSDDFGGALSGVNESVR